MDSIWILSVGLSVALLAFILVHKILPNEKSTVLSEFTIKNSPPWHLLFWLAIIIFIFMNDSSSAEYRVLMAFNFILICFNIWRSRNSQFRFLESGFQNIDNKLIKAEDITAFELDDDKLVIHSTKFLNHVTLQFERLKGHDADELIQAAEDFIARYKHIALTRTAN